MKDEDEDEFIHCLELDEGRLHINKLALALVRDLEAELPAATNQAILALFPGLYQDAAALVERFARYDPAEGIEMTDAEIYTLYVAYDMMGRILTSSYKDFAMTPFEADAPMSEKEKAYVYKTLIMSIETVFKDTEEYATSADCLEELPEIKRKIGQMPAFD